jgi:hypothetical protein
MRKLFLPLLIFILIAFTNCTNRSKLTRETSRDVLQASIIKEGFINCFEKGLAVNQQPVWCEASAIVYDGKNLFFANDKDMPDKRSSVFYWPFIHGFADTAKPAKYLTNGLLKKAKKFEDFALTPDGKTIFLTTGFDRVKPGTNEWNGYNTILYWHVGDEDRPHVLSLNKNDSSSVSLRYKLSVTLRSKDFPNGTPYFKIEGLAASNNLLYLGVREEGKTFENFMYKVKILTVPYSIYNGNVTLGEDFKVLADINIKELYPNLKQPMGISSIEYDHYNNRFIILTSFESGGKVGGYLWCATRSELENNKINLITDGNNNPLLFSNKAEDIAIISAKKIIIIHDDDRFKTSVAGAIRQPHQAAFSIVEFK